MTLINLELLWLNKAFDFCVFSRWLQILSNGQKVDICRTQSSINCKHFILTCLAKANHNAGLGEHCWVTLLDLLQQAQGMEITGAWSDFKIVGRHRFQIMIKHIRARLDHQIFRTILFKKIRESELQSWFLGCAFAPARLFPQYERRPPSARSSRSTEVMTTCFKPSFLTAIATFSGSIGSRAAGLPVLILQNAQALVQTLAHNHHRRMAFVPAFPNIWTGGFFAHSVQAIFPDNPARFLISPQTQELLP